MADFGQFDRIIKNLPRDPRDRLVASQEIDVAHPQTVSGVQMLQTADILTAEEVAILLAP